MPTRRSILQLGLLAGPVALFAPRTGYQHLLAPNQLTYSLFFGETALPGMQDRFANLPLFAPLRQELEAFDREAERVFLSDEVRFNDHLFHVARLANTAWNMGFYFLMTGDHDAAELARDAIRTLMKFSRWDYFLDGSKPIGFQRASKSIMAVSLCIDWLGELISQDERRSWIKTMGERGCEACYWGTYGMRYQDRVEGWRIDPESTYFEHRPGDKGWDLSNWPRFFDNNNLKAEPAGALAVGALTYEREFGSTPDTERWIEQAIYSISGYQDIFERDGSYNEGISYAGATTSHLFQAYAILSRFRSADFYDQLNWPGFMDYAYGLSLPTLDNPAEVVNFSDVGRGLPSAVPFWIAARSGDPTAQWFGMRRSAVHNLWSVMWYDAAIEATPPENKPTLWRSDLEWIVSRTGYETDDLTVAMRSGPPYNHEHGDRNSIIVKCFGEQLIVDPNRPPYTRTDPAWVMRGTVGHSGVLIDGQGHQYVDGTEGTNASDAIAKLVRSGERNGYHFWASDATQAYQLVLPDVTAITRTVIVLYELPAVVLIDKVSKSATPSQIQARFFCYNKDERGSLSATKDRIVITRPHARLQAFAYSPGGIETSTGLLPIPEEKAGLYPFADIRTRDASKTSLLVSVLLPERGAGGVASVDFEEISGTLNLRIRNGNQHGSCIVHDTGALPEFEVTV